MIKVQFAKNAGRKDRASYTEGSVGYAICKNINKLNSLANTRNINDLINFLDADVRVCVTGKEHIQYLEDLIADVRKHSKDFMFNYRHLYNLYLAGTGNGGVMRNVESIK